MCFELCWNILPESVWTPSVSGRSGLCWSLLVWSQTLCLHFSDLLGNLQKVYKVFKLSSHRCDIYRLWQQTPITFGGSVTLEPVRLNTMSCMHFAILGSLEMLNNKLAVLKSWLDSGQVCIPVLARDIRRYFSLVGVPSLAPAVAIAKAEAADRALRLLSSSRHEDITMPLL